MYLYICVYYKMSHEDKYRYRGFFNIQSNGNEQDKDKKRCR
jgi:hypothetical protein